MTLILNGIDIWLRNIVEVLQMQVTTANSYQQCL
jgi:hypothetical protein